MINNQAPQVSIFCLVYNHRDYIERAIESFLMQKTNFNFEIVIGEDYSTDGSREIVFGYAKKYPDLIRLITSDQNVGMKKNGHRTKMALKGKYMAMCEGDDYWTDPLKLQKQVDFLETNPDYSLCFHNAIVLQEDRTPKTLKYFCTSDQKDTTTTADVINKWYIPTASIVVRREYIENLPDWFKDVYNGDWGIQLIVSTKGKIKYINELMSIYRRHLSEGSLHADPSINQEFVLMQKIKLINYFKNEYKGRFDEEADTKLRSLRRELSATENKSFKMYGFRKVLRWICKKLDNANFL